MVFFVGPKNLVLRAKGKNQNQLVARRVPLPNDGQLMNKSGD
jgi:hypothetical protein